MNDLKKDFNAFITSRLFLWPLLIASFIAYAYMIINPSISTDDTSITRYLAGGELIAQGRFGTVIMASLLQIQSFRPIIVESLGLILLIASTILWCILIKRASLNKLHPLTYTVFAVAMISYPLISEIFIYQVSVLAITTCYFLSALSLLILQTYFQKKQKSLFIALIVLMGFVLSTGESFAQVFLAGVVIILILERLYQPTQSFKAMAVKFFTAVLVLVFAIVLKYGITTILIRILDLSPSTNARTGILWLQTSFLVALKQLILANVFRYGLASLYYFPITVFMITLCAGLVLFVKKALKERSVILVLLYAVLVGCVFALSMIQGFVTLYRANQVMAIFVAFNLVLLTQSVLTSVNSKWVKRVALAALALLLFQQVNDLNKWFYVDKLRADEEARVLTQVCESIQAQYGFDQPIIFTGTLALSDNINQYTHLHKNSVGGVVYGKLRSLFTYRLEVKDVETSPYWFQYTQSLGYSFITWGIDAFDEPNTEVITYAHLLGFDLIEGSLTQFKAGQKLSETMPKWPSEGSIRAENGYILVHF